MYKVDCEINNTVAIWFKDFYGWVVDATADCEENHGTDDMVFTGTTGTRLFVKQCEIKSLKNFPFKYNGVWNDYFSTDNPDGITKKMMFGNVPPSNIDITHLPEYWSNSTHTPAYGEMPEEWKNKHIYFLNAEDVNHNVRNAKTYKVYKNNACVIYVGYDGIFLFSPKTLKDAFLGYAWFKNRSHFQEIKNTESKPTYELKAVFDMDKAVYHQTYFPKELFITNYKR